MKRSVFVVLENGSVISEDITKIGDGLTDEQIMDAMLMMLTKNQQEGKNFIIHNDVVININKIVEAYVFTK